jgi:hypothetical protein
MLYLSRHDVQMLTIASTTALELQRNKPMQDPVLTFILQRAERRHHQYQKLSSEPRPKSPAKSAVSKSEDNEWELCLRRYLEFLEALDQRNRQLPPQPSISRNSTFMTESSVSTLVGQASEATPSHPVYRRGDVVDPNRYYRAPRQRSSMVQSIVSTASTERRHSLQSPASSSSALVLYGSSVNSDSTVTLRKATLSADFPWECLAEMSSFGLLSPLMARWPGLREAQADICTQTHGMSASEARAYAQGRLACLGADAVDEIKVTLSDGQAHSGTLERRNSRILSLQPYNPYPSKELQLYGQPKSRTSAQGQRAQNSQILQNTKATRAKAKDGPMKHKLFSLSDLRPLTAISERPRSSRSRASSIDKASTRSIMSAFKSKKSNLSSSNLTKETLEEVSPSTPQLEPKNSVSSGTETLVDGKSIRSVRTARSKGSTPSRFSAFKPLPATPKISISHDLSDMKAKPLPPKPESNKLPRMLALLKPGLRQTKGRIPLPPSVVSLQSQLSVANQSMETVSRVSMEMLRRKDSKMTLISVSEGMDVPFDMWLRALPYIEGRSGTPRNV